MSVSWYERWCARKESQTLAHTLFCHFTAHTHGYKFTPSLFLEIWSLLYITVEGICCFAGIYTYYLPGRVAQSVTCLVIDAKLTADPGVASLIPAQSHTFVEIDHEIISTVILLPSAESFMKGCCQLQAKVCAWLLVNCLFKLAQEKSVVRWTDRPAMTIAVDLGRKATKQTKHILPVHVLHRVYGMFF